MTRSMRDSNRALFYKLEQLAARFRPTTSGGRWLAPDAPEADSWLTSMKLHDKWVEYSPNRKCGISSYNSEDYFVLTGVCEPLKESLPSFLFEVALNAGMFCAIIEDYALEPKNDASPSTVYDLIDTISNAVPGYSGHSLASVSEYFPEVRVYKIDKTNTPFSVELYRLLGLYICCLKSTTLPFTSEVIDAYKRAFLEGNAEAPFEYIQMSMMSTHYRHAFLEIYRCLEFKLPLSYSESLRKELTTNLPAIQIYQKLQDVLGWEPRFGTGLQFMFQKLSPSLQSRIATLHKSCCGPEVNNHSDWLYDIRNTSVHLRPNQAVLINSDTVWNELIIILLMFVCEAF